MNEQQYEQQMVYLSKQAVALTDHLSDLHTIMQTHDIWWNSELWEYMQMYTSQLIQNHNMLMMLYTAHQEASQLDVDS